VALPSADYRERRASLWSGGGALETAGIIGTVALTGLLVFLVGSNAHQAVMFVFMLWIALLGVINPILLLGLFIVQVPLLPRWEPFLAVRVPDWLTPVALTVTASALARALALRRRDVLRPRLIDVLVVAFIAAVFLSIAPDDSAAATQKHAFRSILVPALFYFAVRWLAPDRRTVMALLGALCLATVGMALMVLIQAPMKADLLYGGSALQGEEGSYYQPGAAVGGPAFVGAFLAAVLPLYLFFGWLAGRRNGADSSSPSPARWAMMVSGPAAVCALLGIALCLERAAWLSGAVVLLFCVGVRQLRPRALVLLAAAALAPLALWALSGDTWLRGRALETRNLEDRSRMRRAAIALLRSDEWKPALGIGLGQFQKIGYYYFPPRSGFEDRPLEKEIGRPIHNDYLTVLVETGIVVAASFYGLVLAIIFQFAKLLWPGRRRAAPWVGKPGDYAAIQRRPPDSGPGATAPIQPLPLTDPPQNGHSSVDKVLAAALFAGVLPVLVMAAAHNTLAKGQLLAIFWTFVALGVTLDAWRDRRAVAK